MKRKVLRVRSEGSILPYVTEAESRKQHRDSPLCNSLIIGVRHRDEALGEKNFSESLVVSGSCITFALATQKNGSSEVSGEP